MNLPTYERLKPPVPTWVLPLSLATPLYGGGARTRQVDRVTPVRASSIRGQLRFWWRALFGGQVTSPKGLYARERELWGGLGEKGSVARSCVSVLVRLTSPTNPDRVDRGDVTLNQPDAYALWPARGTQGGPPAERYRPGLEFEVEVRLHSPRERRERDEREVLHTVRAWLMLGGVGGRTRRGCGSLSLRTPAARSEWLPERIDTDTLRAWLGSDGAAGKGFPSLAGAGLCAGPSVPAPAAAWHTAIGWLRDFRQGTTPRAQIDNAPAGDHARMKPSLKPGLAGRPGRSRWPEPDEIRHIFGPRSFDHTPLTPERLRIWPRAQFGLPIQIQWQGQDRERQRYPVNPPPNVMIAWQPDKDDTRLSQRLASPLIVKPAQIRNGQFAPVAIWLSRNLPNGALVGLAMGRRPNDPAGNDRLDDRSTAPMNAPMPAQANFKPLSGKTDMRQAFLEWLSRQQGVRGGNL